MLLCSYLLRWRTDQWHMKKKTTQKKTKFKKTREGDVGLGYFQALWEERMRGVFEEKWEHYKTGSPMGGMEAIPLANLGHHYGHFLLLWLSVSEHQWHRSQLIWTFELLQKIVKQIYFSRDYEQVTFSICLTVARGIIKTGIPHVVASWCPVWCGLKPCFDSRSSYWCQSVDC